MVLQCNCEYANNLDDDFVRLKTLEQVKIYQRKRKNNREDCSVHCVITSDFYLLKRPLFHMYSR